MASVNRNALLPYSPMEMYQLVDDVDAYQEFLPWCRSSGVIERKDDEVRAFIEIARGSVGKRFSTLNRVQPGKMIELELLDGPFKHLKGFWRFEPLGETACKIHLDLEFEFSNRLVSMAFGPIFTQAVTSMVGAFCQRAEQVYGKR